MLICPPSSQAKLVPFFFFLLPASLPTFRLASLPLPSFPSTSLTRFPLVSASYFRLSFLSLVSLFPFASMTRFPLVSPHCPIHLPLVSVPHLCLSFPLPFPSFPPSMQDQDDPNTRLHPVKRTANYLCPDFTTSFNTSHNGRGVRWGTYQGRISSRMFPSWSWQRVHPPSATGSNKKCTSLQKPPSC